MIFQGEFNNSIDPKGRLSIPARFRELLLEQFGGERLVVTKNYDEGVTAYPLKQWEELVSKVDALNPGPLKTSAMRLMIAPAVECGFDKQGRILIPEALRSHAGLQKDVVVVGMDDKIDIYSQSRHEEVTRKAMEHILDNPQAIADLGF